MINTRAILWSNIVLDFLPSQRSRFRCHSFTIRGVLALKVLKRLKLNILSLFTGVPHTWPARYISPAISPLQGEEAALIKIAVHIPYHISPYSLSYVLGVVWEAIVTSPPVNCYLVNDHSNDCNSTGNRLM